MSNRRAFTVPELLAVIALIIIILSLLLPNLTKARDHAKLAVCLSGQHQLSVAWRSYAQENQQKAVGAHTGRPDYDWVVNYDVPIMPANETVDAIRRGTLFQYLNDLGIYKCPSDPRLDYLRTYSMNNYVGGEGWNVTAVLKANLLKQASKTMLFIEEPDPRGYNWGSWVIYPKNHGSATSWIDWAASYHYNAGCTLSFADGRSEFWRWTDPRTAKITWFYENHPGSADLIKLQEVFNPGEY